MAGVEAILARNTVRRLIWVGPVLIAVFAITRGSDGAVGSAIGLAIVAGYLLLFGGMLSVAARVSLGLYHAAALLGFFLRMALLALAMFAVAWLFDVDRVAMGISAIAGYLWLLGWETLAVARGNERELEWT